MAKPKPKSTKTYSKYRSKRTEIDGHKFHSLVEGRRYKELKRQEAKGYIENLTLQPRYKILHPVTKKLICTYVGDFRYERKGEVIVEDVKGVLTDTFRLKSKLMKCMSIKCPGGEVIDGVDITIVKSVRQGRGVYVWAVDGVIEDRP